MKRLQFVDLARGFTVLFVPIIHFFMLFSTTEVHTTIVGYFLIAIAEGPGGQLFMLLMGFSFTLSKNQSLRGVLKKAILLFLVGCCLNGGKFLVLRKLGLLPEVVADELQLAPGLKGDMQILLMGDILHFAAIGLLFLYVVHYFVKQKWMVGAMIILIIIGTPCFWNHSDNYLWQLIGGAPPRVFFPFFPWIAYSLTGYLWGLYYKHYGTVVLSWCGLSGIMLIVLGLFIDAKFHEENMYGFYRTFPGATVWHIGIVLVVIFFWFRVSQADKLTRHLFILEYSSKQITRIYVIQWLLVCWSLSFIPYQSLGLSASITGGILVTFATYFISYKREK